MSITIKAIDILKTNDKFEVREIHDHARSGQFFATYTTLYSEAQALTSARRRAVLLKVKFMGMTETV